MQTMIEQSKKVISAERFTFLLLFCFLAGCNSHSGNQAVAQEIVSLDVKKFEQKLQQTPNAQLIDVRTPEEYAEAHLKGARNINVEDERFNVEIKTLEKDAPVFVYCRSGRRSMLAAEQLKAKGFKTIYNLEGGILSWQQKGKPVEK
ncbi:MAG: hypothetical protein KatS3mg031_0767 [Chitinophagales bacterium]|nr:MAG: hypothetical protein KatS3mg031_0767 [Chitinophagales bacterium]